MLVDKEKWFKAIDETERRWMLLLDGEGFEALRMTCALCVAASNTEKASDALCEDCIFPDCFPGVRCDAMRDDLARKRRTVYLRADIKSNFEKMRKHVRGMKQC